MLQLLIDPAFWAALFSVTLIQVALGADNLIIITILANKLPPRKQGMAVQLGLVLAMLFRIILLGLVSWLLSFATNVFFTVDRSLLGLHLEASVTVKALVLGVGGLILIWKGVKELRVKAKGVGEEVQATDRFAEVVAVIVGMNLLFSIDSILTVVGMTEVFAVMVGSVVISVVLMLVFANPLARFLRENPGAHVRAIARGLGLCRSTLRYHLEQLEKQGLVVSRTELNLKLFFADFAAVQILGHQNGISSQTLAVAPWQISQCLHLPPRQEQGYLSGLWGGEGRSSRVW